jgi:hypothetical protein
VNQVFTSVAVAAQHLTATLQQSTALPPPVDSVVVESPLPGGVAAVVRFLMNRVPPWVQIGGIVVGFIVAVTVLWYVVRRRHAIRAWLGSRSRGVALALAGGAAVAVVALAGMGTATWNYTQHSNEFCTGCHIMAPAFQRFGSAQNKHAELSCHDCHQQSLYASARQVVIWVAERPEKIGAHAKVPNDRCESCHVTGDTARWQRVASTAGHRVHLESDSSALRDVQCVTCHGQEVHRFKPVSQTCGQSGCHNQSETDIELGKMATQTSIHCTSCHAFTAEVPALATRDSARGTLVPGQPQCLGCHEMQKVLSDFDAAKDPHGGKCGTCHNPHEQKTPKAAAATCTTSGCHATWRNEPFHTGAAHTRVGEQCLTCHVPHQAKVDASDCAGCHANVRSRGNLKPPVPFDTTSALRRVSFQHSARISGPSAAFEPDEGAAEMDAATTVPIAWRPPAPADTFSHTRHAKLACLVCHQTGTGLGRLTFERPRGCNICHHQAPATSRCASCHRDADLATPRPVTVTVAVRGHDPKPRPVDFLHTRHTAQTCVACHTTPVSLAPAPAVAQCKSCHTDHHATDRTCAACHANVDTKTPHANVEVAHQRCDACHATGTVERLTPTRSFCAMCHAEKSSTHYEGKECTTCHFLASPEDYKRKLVAPPR